MRALIDRVLRIVRPVGCHVPQACPAASRRRRLLRLWIPLVLFAAPTVVIAYGFVIPKTCIAGFNGLSFGFGTTVLGACMTYVAGIRAALKG
jgi:hypothetical protein